MATLRQALCATTLCALVGSAASAQTPKEAEALVQEVIAYAKANGNDAALKAITAGDKFKRYNGELYVFAYDFTGKVVGHGQGASKVNVNQMNAKDPDGKEYIKERIELAKNKSKGWHDYKYRNPVTNKLEDKTSYIEVHGGIIWGAGIYKK